MRLLSGGAGVGTAGQASQAAPKNRLEKDGKGDWFGSFIVVSGWGQHGSFHVLAVACVV